MSRFPDAAAALLAAALIAPAAFADEPAQGRDGGFGLGREASPEEVALWDIDVRPDGKGLPEGSGSVEDGEEVWSYNCAHCHGDFAEGIDRWPVLAGGEGTLANDRPVKTIGSYWPYLSTVYDYVNRAMPFGYSQSLSPDDIYAITAYLLYSNYLVEDDFVLTHENFAEIEMPNAPNFFMDDRAETEVPQFSAEPCMSDCKDSVEITARAVVLDVTPEDGEAGGGID
ncbi:cytochrome C [Meridianimarinicoccus roseus]|uniref:Cytochrome C n=1 Tax=Meridianimarinicoccus roseus TaxID=2072018 RepID=A0A2V2LFG3_9RHOB|nr:cytochrome C [Meridianimarinicoccus roseus]